MARSAVDVTLRVECHNTDKPTLHNGLRHRAVSMKGRAPTITVLRRLKSSVSALRSRLQRIAPVYRPCVSPLCIAPAHRLSALRLNAGPSLCTWRSSGER